MKYQPNNFNILREGIETTTRIQRLVLEKGWRENYGKNWRQKVKKKILDETHIPRLNLRSPGIQRYGYKFTHKDTEQNSKIILRLMFKTNKLRLLSRKEFKSRSENTWATLRHLDNMARLLAALGEPKGATRLRQLRLELLSELSTTRLVPTPEVGDLRQIRNPYIITSMALRAAGRAIQDVCEPIWRDQYGPDWMRTLNDELATPHPNPRRNDLAFLVKALSVDGGTLRLELSASYASINELVSNFIRVRNKWSHAMKPTSLAGAQKALARIAELLDAFPHAAATAVARDQAIQMFAHLEERRIAILKKDAPALPRRVTGIGKIPADTHPERVPCTTLHAEDDFSEALTLALSIADCEIKSMLTSAWTTAYGSEWKHTVMHRVHSLPNYGEFSFDSKYLLSHFDHKFDLTYYTESIGKFGDDMRIESQIAHRLYVRSLEATVEDIYSSSSMPAGMSTSQIVSLAYDTRYVRDEMAFRNGAAIVSDGWEAARAIHRLIRLLQALSAVHKDGPSSHNDSLDEIGELRGYRKECLDSIRAHLPSSDHILNVDSNLPLGDNYLLIGKALEILRKSLVIATDAVWKQVFPNTVKSERLTLILKKIEDNDPRYMRSMKKGSLSADADNDLLFLLNGLRATRPQIADSLANLKTIGSSVANKLDANHPGQSHLHEDIREIVGGLMEHSVKDAIAIRNEWVHDFESFGNDMDTLDALIVLARAAYFFSTGSQTESHAATLAQLRNAKLVSIVEADAAATELV